MDPASPNKVTQCLIRLRDGDARASDELFEFVYDELRALAGSWFKHENANHTLQPTAIVHEAYMKLVNQKDATFTDKAHFLAVAASSIRRILIDHSRKRGAAKRTPPTQVTLEFGSAEFEAKAANIEAVDLVLTRLAALNERHAKIVEMRFFAGMTVEETASVLEVSPTLVKGDWRIARAWLQRELEREGFA